MQSRMVALHSVENPGLLPSGVTLEREASCLTQFDYYQDLLDRRRGETRWLMR